MISAAFAGVIRASLSSKSESMAAPSWLGVLRPLRAIPVLIPPGCTHVTPTGCPLMSISWRSASVKPRTAYFVAL